MAELRPVVEARLKGAEEIQVRHNKPLKVQLEKQECGAPGPARSSLKCAVMRWPLVVDPLNTARDFMVPLALVRSGRSLNE